MTRHMTGTREEWLAARLELLEAEKELTRRSDELARRRQKLPWVRVDKPDMRISLHPALGQDLTPSPTARRAQAGSDARARRSRRGAGVDSCRPCLVWFCA